MKHAIIHIVMLIVFLPSKLFGQEICGYVYDNEGNPLCGATIHEDKTTLGAVTDSLGYFEFRYCSKKSNFFVAHIGYKTRYFNLKDVNNTIEINLEPEVYTIDEGCWIFPGSYLGLRYSCDYHIPFGFEFVYSTYPLDILVQGNYDSKYTFSYKTKVEKTILNRDYCPIIDLIYEFKFRQESDIAKNINHHCFILERERGKCQYGLGLGYSDLELKNYSNKTFGGLISIEYPFYKPNSKVNFRTYYWIDYMQFDLTYTVLLVNKFDLSFEYSNTKGMQEFLIKIGYRFYK